MSDEMHFWMTLYVIEFRSPSISIWSLLYGVNNIVITIWLRMSEYLKHRKCPAQKNSGKLLCDTRNSFFAQLFIFPLCATFDV